MSEKVRPTRVDGGMHDDYKEEHPAYAMIGAARVSTSPGKALFGSDFLHQHYVVVSIHEASLNRGLSSDWHHAGKLVSEVALSEAQWATFVSSMNVGFGVPATFQWREGVGYVPGIEPDLTRREQFAGEVADHMKEAVEALDGLLADIDSGKGKKVLRDKAEAAKRAIGGNLKFVSKSFDEHMEKTVEKAKIEVNAYATQMLIRTGIDALGGNADRVISLPDETETK